MSSTNVLFQTKGKGSKGTQRSWGSGHRQECRPSLQWAAILSRVLTTGSQEQHVEFLSEEVSLTTKSPGAPLTKGLARLKADPVLTDTKPLKCKELGSPERKNLLHV